MMTAACTGGGWARPEWRAHVFIAINAYKTRSHQNLLVIISASAKVRPDASPFTFISQRGIV